MASADLLCVFTPHSNNPPSSNYATFDTRNGLLVLDFDASTDESALFTGVLPPNYAGGGLSVSLHWMATSATSGSCRWQTAVERHQAGTDDQDSDSFAAANSAGTAAAAPSGTEMVTAVTHAAGGQMDSLAAGERFRLKVTRDADGTSGTDDMVGDAELVIIRITEL